jgi:hypothetical protein
MEARSAAYRGTVPWERTSMAITLAQAIRNAIAAEQAAERFYLSMTSAIAGNHRTTQESRRGSRQGQGSCCREIRQLVC